VWVIRVGSSFFIFSLQRKNTLLGWILIEVFDDINLALQEIGDRQVQTIIGMRAAPIPLEKILFFYLSKQ